MGHRDLLVTQTLSQPPGNHRSVPLTRSVRRAGGLVQTVLSECGPSRPSGKSHIPIIRLLEQLAGLIRRLLFVVASYTQVVQVPKRRSPPSTLWPLSRALRWLTSILSGRLLPRPALRRELQRGRQSCRNSPRDTRTHRSDSHSSTSESLLSRVWSTWSDRRP